VERDPFKPANAERCQPVLMLEPSELALDGGTSAVEVAPPLGLSRDQLFLALLETERGVTTTMV
jgi:hypothetical protein